MSKILSDEQIAKLKFVPNAKDDNRCSKHSLGGAKGLYLFIYRPNKDGVSVKRYKIKRFINGKDETLALKDDSGNELTFPKTSASKARSIALAIESEEIINRAQKHSGAFSYYANELFSFDEKILSPLTLSKKKLRYEKFIAPFLANKPVTAVTTPMVIEVLKNAFIKSAKAKKGNGFETAHKVKSIIKQVLDYAMNYGEIKYNPVPLNLTRILGIKNETEHFATLLKDSEIKDFIFALKNAKNSVSKNALFFMMLTPLRGGTLRQLEWSEIKCDEGIMYLDIPAHKMKMKKNFLVALSDRACEILNEQRKMRVNKFIFGIKNSKKDFAFSDATLTRLIEQIGFKGRIVPHGLRAMFSSICNRNFKAHGLGSEIIELCLAHSISSIKGEIAAAYDRDHKLAAQKELFDWYANYLENLESFSIKDKENCA